MRLIFYGDRNVRRAICPLDVTIKGEKISGAINPHGAFRLRARLKFKCQCRDKDLIHLRDTAAITDRSR